LQNGTSTGQYTLHQAKGDASAGSRKSGYLSKRSEGRLRNVWQRRRCSVRDGLLEIFHADESKAPTQVGLLTCQMKPVAEDRLCFDVVSFNRTYHFQVELLVRCLFVKNLTSGIRAGCERSGLFLLIL
jgi:Arf-GAP/SH3 domain/ANK repeat/PH domain-containing protein